MGGKNILYAEDNPDDVLIFTISLTRAELDVKLHCVDDGAAAIAWLAGENGYADRSLHPLPDVLILDLKMPRKNGFDVLEWLRGSMGFEHLPVVILSSSDDPRDLQRAEGLGVAKYFMKSALSEDVVEYLRSLV